MERVFALITEFRVGGSRVRQGERKVKYPDRIPVSGKTPELRKSLKNKVSRKVSQKFPKIINIILRFLVKSVFRNSISFSR